jgi:hypothetical protein
MSGVCVDLYSMCIHGLNTTGKPIVPTIYLSATTILKTLVLNNSMKFIFLLFSSTKLSLIIYWPISLFTIYYVAVKIK